MNVDSLFNREGNSPKLESLTGADYVRERDRISKHLFGADGSLTEDAEAALEDFAEEHKGTLRPFSLVAEILTAEQCARKTKGNYSTMTLLWR